MTKTTAELLAEKKAEVVALEEKMLTEIDGQLAVVKRDSYHGDIEVGAIVKLSRNDGREYPIRGVLLDESDFDVYMFDDVEILTQAQARERMIADVDRKLAEIYGQEGA